MEMIVIMPISEAKKRRPTSIQRLLRRKMDFL